VHLPAFFPLMRKASRIRPAEREALNLYLSKIQIPDDTVVSPDLFKNKNSPLFLEIGFGKGEFLYKMAVQHPDINFVGIEIFITGVAKLIRKMCNYDNSNPPQPENIKILIKDARLALKENFLDNSIQKVFILFPDPWPKKRHHKRRLINSEFAQLLRRRLVKDGSVLIATDHEGYLEVIREVMKETGFKEEISSEPLVLETRYAKKALERGGQIYQFLFRK